MQPISHGVCSPANANAADTRPLLRGAIIGGTLPTTTFLVFAPVVASASVLQSWSAYTGLSTAVSTALAAVAGVGRFLDLATSVPVVVVSGAVFAFVWSRWSDHAVAINSR